MEEIMNRYIKFTQLREQNNNKLTDVKGIEYK